MARLVYSLLAAVALASHTRCQATADDDTTDYVIVGGGTAGCALAARLCEGMPDKQFTILERGSERTPDQEFLVRAVRNAFYAWDEPALVEEWESEPVPGCNDRKLRLLTGNTLGGCSAINGAHWTQPGPWVAAKWGFAGLTKRAARRLFKKAAAQVQPAPPPKSLRQTYLTTWLAAARAAGIKIISRKTPWGMRLDRAWVLEMAATRAGERRDSCTAYLSPLIGDGGACAANVRIVQGATAAAVRLDKSKSYAIGVDWRAGGGGGGGGTPNTVYAREEVIVSAGPYGSPKLLQLSGIGPKALLDSLGIPIAKELPVGQNAQMQPYSFLTYDFPGVPLPRENNRTLLKSAAAREQFEAGNGGVLGVGITQIDGTLRESDAIISSQTANIAPYDNERQFGEGCFINPTSRGTISAASAEDAAAPPRVQPNFFSDPQEAENALLCLKRHQEIMANFPDRFEMQPVYPPAPVTTDSVRETASDGSHVVGGCAVGPVLDPYFKVKGVGNLRVVDSSALPEMPYMAGPLATVYVLAELAAEQMLTGN